MIPDIDIWRSENVMIKRYGETAALEASMRADDLLEAGDTEGDIGRFHQASGDRKEKRLDRHPKELPIRPHL